MFERPDHEKCADLKRWALQDHMGYIPMLSEGVNPKRAPDIREAYVIKSHNLFNNDFRGTPQGFEQTVSASWDKAEVAARRFSIACALALGLPTANMDYFAKCMRRFDTCQMKYQVYPQCEFVPDVTDGPSGSASIRIGEHCDFGAFTFLFMDGPARGLQARKTKDSDALSIEIAEDDDQTWLDVPGRGGAVAVVNSGAMLAQWTNDQWKATAHRVIVPDAEAAAQRRYTLPFFVIPDSDALLEPHPVLVPEGEEPRYAPITCEEYFNMRFKTMPFRGKKIPGVDDRALSRGGA
jgi:isopenicillin N synthase-like dioxygenase